MGVEYAQWARLWAAATAGRPHKHVVLRRLGVDVGMSSRDGGAFAAGAAASLRGARLSGVLNSLSHDFVSTSLALLVERRGCFAEIGKRGVWSGARASAAAAGTQYDVLALDSVMEREPVWIARVLRVLSARASAQIAWVRGRGW